MGSTHSLISQNEFEIEDDLVKSVYYRGSHIP